MPVLYHLTCGAASSPLIRLSDGRFQIIEDGPLTPLMTGYKYFLVDQALAEYLEALKIPNIRFEPATIWHREHDRNHSSHTELVVERTLSPKEIAQVEVSGHQVFALNDRYLFISPLLKLELENSNFNDLQFSEGLSEFAGEL